MPVPSSVTDLDPVASNNSPAGSEPIGQNLDEYLRAHAAIIRQVSDASNVGTQTHAATSKATPVDADELPLSDSGASFALKKLSWANLKAAIKTFLQGGMVMTGALTLFADPANALDAATKQYVDAKAGGGMPSASQVFVAATGIDANVFISAPYVVVQNSAGNTKLLSNFQQTVNLATSGAGGLDTGAVAANSWYGIWALAKDDGTQSATAALCVVLTGNTTSGNAVVTNISSTANLAVGMPVFSVNFPAGTVIKSVDSGTQVTMSRNALATTTGVNITYVYDPVIPAGYTWKGLITCAIRTDGTANKYPQAFTKLGRRVTPKVAAGTNVTQMPLIASGVNGNAGTPTWVAISLANYVSPLAVEATFGVAVNAAAGTIMMLAPNGNYGANTSTTNRAPFIYSTSTSGTTDGTAQGKLLLESGNIYYISAITNSYLFLYGYEESI